MTILKSPSANPEGSGSVHRTGASALAAFFCVGLTVGWAFHYFARARTGIDPSLNWPTAGVIYFLAAFLALAAWRTHQAQSERVRLAAHRAVNLLVLAKASARVGAAVAGAYAGFALGYLRSSMPIPASQFVLVGLTCLGGVLLVIAALALEQACRVRGDDDEDGDTAGDQSPA